MIENLHPCVEETMYYAKTREEAIADLAVYALGTSLACERIQNGQKCQYFVEAYRNQGSNGECVKPREEWRNDEGDSATQIKLNPYDEHVLNIRFADDLI